MIYKNKVNKRKILHHRAKKLRKRMTAAEIHILKLLKELKLKFVSQKIFWKGNSCAIADFYLTTYKIVLEIDGGYHNTAHQSEKDRLRTWAIITNNSDVYLIRLTNEEALELDSTSLKKILTSAVLSASFKS